MSEPIDEATEPNDDPGCPGTDCSSQGVWRDIIPSLGWGGGQIQGLINWVQLVTPQHDSTIRRAECRIKVKTDGTQTDDVYAQVSIYRRIDLFPDALLKSKVLAIDGQGTFIADLGRLLYKDQDAWRYYGRIEIRRVGYVGLGGYLNGPVGPAWKWLE